MHNQLAATRIFRQVTFLAFEVQVEVARTVAMDAKFREILDALPDKPPRSRLEPYREFIEELRRRGRTYVDIASILAEKCQVQVTASGAHDFVRTRSQVKGRSPMRLPFVRNSRMLGLIAVGELIDHVTVEESRAA
jgi:hypothetical protein